MSVFDASMEPMLEMFIYETTTLLDQLDEILLETEKVSSMTDENINSIFRIMHTVKGSAAMMGLTGISELAHHVEDMFFIFREDTSKLGQHNSSCIFDLLFQASDFLKSEVEGIQSREEYEPANSSPLTKRIEHEILVLKGEATPVSDTATTAAPLTTAASGIDDSKIHQIRVFFEDDCQMENIRAFMLISQLKEACEYLDTDPPNPESNSGCSADIIKNGLLIRIKPSTEIEDIYSIIENAINIKSYESVASAPIAAAAENSTSADASPNAATANDFAPPLTVAPTAPAASGQSGVKVVGKQSLISVNQLKLDQLMDIMGEIVIAESMVASNPELRGLHLDNFYKSTRQLRKLTDQLQDIVMSIRMVPLSGVFQKMNRIVRDMNKKLGKEVELVTLGGDTEVDKTINDILADPFMHMIRNAMDHAIEPREERIAAGKPDEGTLTLSAQNVGGEIVITVADDGRGLCKESIIRKAKNNGLLTKSEAEYTDKEIFNMIMLPGFSTNEVITEYSGRGVGMDVVRKNIESVNGSISVESKPGNGTVFTIKIPLTLAIVDGMEIAVSHDTFTIPITSIKQTFKLSEETTVLHDTDGTEMIMLRGDCYPIMRLHQVYCIQNAKTELEDGIFVLVENDRKAACIFVDYLIGEQQVVVKPFPQFLNRYNIKNSGLAGCTIMGDGSISLILDINNFLNKF